MKPTAILTLSTCACLLFTACPKSMDDNAGPGPDICPEEMLIYTSQNSTLNSDEVLHIIKSPDDRLYISTRESLDRISTLDLQNLSFSTFSAINGYDRTTGRWVTDFHDNEILLGAAGYNTLNGNENYGGGFLIVRDQELNVFNLDNSPIPSNYVSTVRWIDGRYWIGLGNNYPWSGGLVIYDGADWEIFNRDNSIMPVSSISDVVQGPDGAKWLIVLGHGMVKIDNDNNWQLFDETSLFGEAAKDLTTIEVDQGNNVWLGTVTNGLLKFDGVSVKSYNIDNSGIPSRLINDIAIRNGNEVLVATAPYISEIDPFGSPVYAGGGFAIMREENFEVFDKDNSNLPSNTVNSVETGLGNQVWLATSRGLVMACVE